MNERAWLIDIENPQVSCMATTKQQHAIYLADLEPTLKHAAIICADEFSSVFNEIISHYTIP